MSNEITLKEAIEGVITCQRKNGHPDSYINCLRYIYNRLLRHAEELGADYLSSELTERFLSDTNISRSGEYRHERFLEHYRCIRFLNSFMKTGEVSIKKYHEPVGECISNGLAQALNIYDQAEEDSGLSQSTRVRPHGQTMNELSNPVSIGDEYRLTVEMGILCVFLLIKRAGM